MSEAPLPPAPIMTRNASQVASDMSDTQVLITGLHQSFKPIDIHIEPRIVPGEDLSSVVNFPLYSDKD